MKYKTWIVVLSLILSSALLIGGARMLSVHDHGGEQKRVATSFYPIYIAALNLTEGIDEIEVINLTEGQTDCLHDFTLRPQDMVTLEGCAALLINGGGMETFLTAVDGAYPALPIIDSSAGMENHAAPAAEMHDHDHDHDHDHGENTHYWLSPAHYEMQIEALCHGLTEVFPQYQKQIEANAESYIADVHRLQEAYRTQMAPYAGQHIVILNEAFAYLAMDCGLEVAGSVHMEQDTALSAALLGQITDSIRAHDVSVVLAEPQYSGALAQTVERETGALVCTLDAATGGANHPDAYLNCMYENLDLLVRALKGKG
ncbi:MAG: zinc ABC transporter substrate-binding protein [Clostridia bacterium]|nr:zinc ABC transporter substrate-binding protein [Clostridia bacterium]